MLKLLASAQSAFASIADKAKYLRFVFEHCADDDILMSILFLFFIGEILEERNDD